MALIEEKIARLTTALEDMTLYDTPAGVNVADLAAYCLMLGDDALVLSHRLQQWVTRAPELEDELAIANLALDLLGQARLLLTRAGEVEGAGRDEDALAYLRDAGDFRNPGCGRTAFRTGP